jgi:outer membrane protein insertion porin family
MSLQEGAVVDASALRNSLLRLRQLEIFEIDEADPVAFDFHSEDQTVDLLIKGEEGEPTDLLFGGGFSEDSGFFGQFQFLSRNFLGRGETVGVTLQAGERQSQAELSYLVPWFLERPQQLGFSLFWRDREYTLLSEQNVEENRVGGSLTHGRRLGLFGNLSTTYTRYDSDETATDFTDPEHPTIIETEREVSLVRLGLVHDRRDSRLQPTEGQRASLTLDWAGGLLGGNTDFLRPQATYSRYLPLTRRPLQSLLAFNVEAGLIEPLEGEELFSTDRFFLGGENSVRGFELKSIMVRDEAGNPMLDANGFALGGDRSLQLNLEYHMLLGGPFRLLAFADGGKVFGEDQSFALDDFRISTGLELQIKLPILGAPLRLIWAHNVDPLPEDRFQTFQFSIGPSF